MDQSVIIPMDSILALLNGLSNERKKWLADKLYEDIKLSKKNRDYPKIPKDYRVSPETLAMTAGPLPKGVDLDKLMDDMWEDFAK